MLGTVRCWRGSMYVTNRAVGMFKLLWPLWGLVSLSVPSSHQGSPTVSHTLRKKERDDTKDAFLLQTPYTPPTCCASRPQCPPPLLQPRLVLVHLSPVLFEFPSLLHQRTRKITTDIGCHFLSIISARHSPQCFIYYFKSSKKSCSLVPFYRWESCTTETEALDHRVVQINWNRVLKAPSEA